jgi:hypothetical protein
MKHPKKLIFIDQILELLVEVYKIQVEDLYGNFCNIFILIQVKNK